MNPTPEQQDDFLNKVVPLAERLVAAESFTVRSGNAITRAINLAMGLSPRTKAEAQFQDKLLAMVAMTYPGNEYPAMCPPQTTPVRVH